ncbi:MAG: trypsin-like peptidase domain-containing protein [Gammaproteobacteria bacterium]|nr:trypsin-like peptidase domain-containing protein [Gammaproteobacteria bacterium]
MTIAPWLKQSVKPALVLLVVLTLYCSSFWFMGAVLNTDTPANTQVWVPPTIQQMADTTVTILIDQPCPNPDCGDPLHGKGHGSGVLVGPGQILTAAHLILNKHPDTVYSIRYQAVAYPVDFITEDPDSDLAVFFCDTLPDHPVAELSMLDPPLGADVYLIGSPVKRFMHGRVVKGNVSCLHREAILGDPHMGYPEWAKARWGRIVGMALHTAHGNSGGPVFYNGKVVGIFVGFPLVRDHRIGYQFSVYVPVYELNVP